MIPMKPTQEQVIAWAREAGATRDYPEHLPDLWTMDTEGFLMLATLVHEAAYEAGRKDENEACVEEAAYYAAHSLTAKNILDAIRARREQ